MININRTSLGYRPAYNNSALSLETREEEISNIDNNRNDRNKIQYNYPRHLCFNGRERNKSVDCQPLNNRSNEENRINLKEAFYLASDELVKEIHIENLKQNLEKRLQTAKNKGDDRLVSLLKREFKQLAN